MTPRTRLASARGGLVCYAAQMGDEKRIARRGFFRRGFLEAAKVCVDTVSGFGKGLSRIEQHLQPVGPEPATRHYQARPPGAVPQEAFLTLCTQCNDCVAACPAWAIRKATEREENTGYPLLEPELTACALCDDPLPCIAACETGALVPTPRMSVRLGLARLVPGRCVIPKGQDCDLCLVSCPIPEEAIRITEDGPIIIAAGCTGCGLCAVMCPEEALSIGAV